MSQYSDRLHQAILTKGTPALVGLDPRFDQLPPQVIEHAQQSGGDQNEVSALAFEEFCKRIIDIVSPLVPAVKPQSAFFEQLGPAGCLALQKVIRHARRAGLIVICDAKRGDIGSTAEAYAQAYLAGEDPDSAPFSADCLTVNPYLGIDTLGPFAKVCLERNAGLYVLVRTSNPGAGSFQDHTEDSLRLYEKVAIGVEQMNAPFLETSQFGFGSIGAVVGATYPRELEELRELMPHVPLLIPGYGAQGGGASDVASAFNQQGLGGLINNSRGINFAYLSEPYNKQFSPENWEQAVELATLKMIDDLASHTPAKSLR